MRTESKQNPNMIAITQCMVEKIRFGIFIRHNSLKDFYSASGNVSLLISFLAM